MKYYKFLTSTGVFASLVFMMAFFVSSCSVIGGIFKAGMGVGIFLVIVVIVIIGIIVMKLGKK